MRIHFLTGPLDAAPAHSVEFNGPAELYLWLVERPDTYCVAVECNRGPVLILGPRAGYLTVRGGLTIKRSDVDELWRRCEDQMRHENGLDEFLDNGINDLVRQSLYPKPKLVRPDDSA